MFEYREFYDYGAEGIPIEAYHALDIVNYMLASIGYMSLATNVFSCVILFLVIRLVQSRLLIHS
jgi:hypothetical protein